MRNDHLQKILLISAVASSSCGPMSVERLDFRSKSASSTSDAGNIATTSQIAGVESTAIAANIGGTIRSQNASLQGSSITITPGSIAVGTEITIEEGGSFASDPDIESLGIGDSNQIQSEGIAVIIESSEAIDASSPMTLQIPAPSLGLRISGGSLVVIAKIRKSAGGFYFKIFTDVELEDDFAQFSSSNFGAFQAVYLENPVEEDVEVPAQTPIIRKVARDELAGVWGSECTIEGEGSKDYKQSDVVFSGEEFGFRLSFFNQDAECAKLGLQFGFRGTYSTEDIPERLDVEAIDLTIERVSLRAVSEDVANELNRVEFCQITNWDSGEIMDLSDKFGGEGCNFDKDDPCGESKRMAAGSKIYSIFAIEDGLLRLGKDEKEADSGCEIYGDSPETRQPNLEDISNALTRK